MSEEPSSKPEINPRIFAIEEEIKEIRGKEDELKASLKALRSEKIELLSETHDFVWCIKCLPSDSHKRCSHLTYTVGAFSTYEKAKKYLPYGKSYADKVYWSHSIISKKATERDLDILDQSPSW